MAVTDDQYQAMLARLTALENHANNLTVAIEHYITLDQLQELLVVLQTSIDDFSTRLTSLEVRTSIIENEPLT